jgi:hypothetical protein
VEIDLSWPHIHELEMIEAYPDAIDALEARLAVAPNDPETVTRLGFNLWFAVVEDTRMARHLPVEHYAARFMQLFHRHGERLKGNADFCWVFGLGMSLFWFYLSGVTEEQGKSLLDRARALDPFWANFQKPGADLSRLKGRGIFERYYNVP